MGLLDDILQGVREDVAARRRARPDAELEALAAEAPPAPSLQEALREGTGPRIIAEIKRTSPSRGALRPQLDPAALARSYVEAGAIAISCLTEPRRFGGSLDDLVQVAAAVPVPVLRKDFIVDRYQLLEARTAGAAAVLLIVRALPGDALERMLDDARFLGLEALCEVHDEAEAARLHALEPAIVGVNNRDLDTLAISLETSRRVAPHLPAAAARVAESGITRPADIASLETYGYDGFLVGTHLLAQEDPAAALRALLRDPRSVPGGESPR